MSVTVSCVAKLARCPRQSGSLRALHAPAELWVLIATVRNKARLNPGSKAYLVRKISQSAYIVFLLELLLLSSYLLIIARILAK